MAVAAGNCAQAGWWYAGWWSSKTLSGHEAEGTDASLTYRSAASCQGLLDASYAGWVMIAGNADRSHYAQAGFMFDGNPLGCIRHFVEYNLGSGFHRVTGSCVSAGEVHIPKVMYATGPQEQMWIDSTKLATFSGCVCFWSRPLVVELSGEVHDINGDVPGLAGSKVDWSSVRIQYLSDNSWHGTCSTITLFKLVTNNRFAADSPACDHNRSWTAQP